MALDEARQCRSVVDDIAGLIPRPWHLESFVDALAERRGRPIRILSIEVGRNTPCGLWVSTDLEDILIGPRGTTIYHRDHVIAHEIGHLLLDGGGVDTPPGDAEIAALPLPDIPPDLIRMVLGRGGYESSVEQRAEVFAEMLMTKVHTQKVSATEAGQLSPEQRGIVRRLGVVLDNPRTRPWRRFSG